MKIILTILIIISTMYSEDLKYENLLQSIPSNFKLGYKNYNKQTHVRLFEFIQKNEKIDNWSQMITTSIYHQNINITPKQYIEKIKSIWGNSCKNSYTKDLPSGTENSYKFSLIMLYCPKNKLTNKEELTFLKAIKGKDSFYTVQKAFRYDPGKKGVIKTIQYLKNITVCDTRLNNCPK